MAMKTVRRQVGPRMLPAEALALYLEDSSQSLWSHKGLWLRAESTGDSCLKQPPPSKQSPQPQPHPVPQRAHAPSPPCPSVFGHTPPTPAPSAADSSQNKPGVTGDSGPAPPLSSSQQGRNCCARPTGKIITVRRGAGGL